MAIEVNPWVANAYNNRGNALEAKGQYNKACSDWRQACELGLCEQYETADCK